MASLRAYRVWALWAICAVALGGARDMSHSEGLTLYVSADGKDAWSGRVAAPATGDGPFASLERARDEIRKIRGAGALPDGRTSPRSLRRCSGFKCASPWS